MVAFPKSTQYKIVTLNRKPSMRESIIAVYAKNAKDGDMPIWIGPRKNLKKFLASLDN